MKNISRKNIKRKAISLMLAVVLALSLSVSAFAAGTDIDQSSADMTGKTAISYVVNPTYTVTIPASVEIGNSATISASDVVVDEGSTLKVSITGTSGDNDAFTIASNDGSDTLEYTVKDRSEKKYALNDTVLEVDPASSTSGSVTLTFALADGETPRYSGTYSGTMTFTVVLGATN